MLTGVLDQDGFRPLSPDLWGAFFSSFFPPES